MSYLIDIIIVNWNSGNLLKDCIESIYKSTIKSNVKTIIVDNASTDDSLSLISEVPNLHIVRNDENLGFARACNQGLTHANSKYVLFLNPDTKIKSDTLQKCIDLAEKTSDFDILGVKHINDLDLTQPSCSRFPTLIHFFYDIVGLSRILPQIFKPATLMLDWDHNKSGYVDQVMGAFMFIRRDLFKKIGLFDEDYFVYFEDLDLSYRLHLIGGKSYHCADIVIFHKGGGTSNQVVAKRLLYLLTSRLIYVKKHFPLFKYLQIWFLTLFIEPVTRFLFLCVRFEFDATSELFQTYRDLYTNQIFRRRTR